jgi:hypothetical protein
MPTSSGTARRTRRKTCHRCGRTGSHAFRRTVDGVYECTTATACRARQRRNAGPRNDGRGRLARKRANGGASGLPAIAYVIGPPSSERDEVVRIVHERVGMAVLVGEADGATLAAISTRDVQLIAVHGACLVSVAFRNELRLRHAQPRLRSVPIMVYGAAPPPIGAEAFGQSIQPFAPGSPPLSWG